MASQLKTASARKARLPVSGGSRPRDVPGARARRGAPRHSLQRLHADNAARAHTRFPVAAAERAPFATQAVLAAPLRPRHNDHDYRLARRRGPVPAWVRNATPYVDNSLADLGISKFQRKSLLELDNNTCRWPVGDPTHHEFFFCGAQPLPGKPFCALHCARAFVAQEGTGASAYTRAHTRMGRDRRMFLQREESASEPAEQTDQESHADCR
jgi:hypothetical protein